MRVIATSNRYMLDEVKAGRFREDLYYRLNVFPLATRALSDGRCDILPITISLFSKHANGFAHMPEMTQAAIDKLESYDWPCNVRELKNVLKRAIVLSGAKKNDVDHLMIDPQDIYRSHSSAAELISSFTTPTPTPASRAPAASRKKVAAV